MELGFYFLVGYIALWIFIGMAGAFLEFRDYFLHTPRGYK